jgi:hypothetical protein
MKLNGRKSPRRRLVAPGAAVLAAAALGLAGSSNAHAGTYQITQCADPDGGPSKGVMADWLSPNAKAVNGCSTGGLFGIETASNVMGPNTTADHHIDIPSSQPNISLAKAELWYYTHRVIAGSDAYAFVTSGGARLVDEWAGTDHTRVAATVTPPVGARNLRLSVFCSGSAGGASCVFAGRDVVTHTKMRLTLAELVSPTASVDGGSLLASGARTGVENVTFSAEDVDSGVALAQLRLGNAVVATADFSADCPRDNWAACRRARPGEELEVDTSKVSDGVHALSLRVVDAAGNARVVSAGEVTVDNVRDEVREVPMTPTGPGSSAGAPTAGSAAAGGLANGTNASADARLVSYVGSSRATSARTVYGRRLTLRGRLTDPSGRPIAGATLAVLTQVGGAAMREVDQVRTDADGRWSYAVPAGPSRVIRFAYKASTADATFASTSDVTLRVAAKARLRVTPGRVRNGRAVTFRGVVLGGHLPRRGVHVDLQVRQGGWRTFGVARANRAGRFSFRYRFTRTFRPTSYTFRAKVRGEAGVPYDAGLSNRAKVVVR